jgi:hypothetical protein
MVFEAESSIGSRGVAVNLGGARLKTRASPILLEASYILMEILTEA